LSSATSVVGVAITTFCSNACTNSDGSNSSATLKNASLGRNITTHSGARSNCSQYALRLNVSMCRLTLITYS